MSTYLQTAIELAAGEHHGEARGQPADGAAPHASPAPIEDYRSDPAGTACATGAQPGAAALMAEIAARHGGRGEIFACRPVRGTTRMSLHGEGRAVDWYRDARDPAQAAEAQQILAWLTAADARGNAHAVARRLGVQEIIYDGRIWTARRHGEGWRPYTGVHRHADHIHIGLNWPGARMQTTYWTVRAPAAALEGPGIDAKRAGKAVVKDAIDRAIDGPLRDEVDDYLEARTNAFKLELSGTRVVAALPLAANAWHEDYTNLALARAGTLAMARAIYDPKVRFSRLEKRIAAIKYSRHRRGPAAYVVIVSPTALEQLGQELGLELQAARPPWRERLAERLLHEAALQEARKNFDQIRPHLPAKNLAAARTSADQILAMLSSETWIEFMVGQAAQPNRATPWRRLLTAHPELRSGAREPSRDDFNAITPNAWADALVALAGATLAFVRKESIRRLREMLDHQTNEHLRPHEIKIDLRLALDLVLKTYDSTRIGRADMPNLITGRSFGTLEIRGGQTWTNLAGQKIFVLSGDDDGRVVYQNLVSGRFFRQTLDGFGHEQGAGVWAEAGRKLQDFIVIERWMFEFMGICFPPARYLLLASDVTNVAFKLKRNRLALEQSYGAAKTAYDSIDTLVPGLLPALWDAVLDKDMLTILDLKVTPNFADWSKFGLKLLLALVKRRAGASFAADAGVRLLRKAWESIADGLRLISPPSLTSAARDAVGVGISRDRAIALAIKKLEAIGLAQAKRWVELIHDLPAPDRERLVREIKELMGSGTRFVDLLKQSLSWP